MALAVTKLATSLFSTGNTSPYTWAAATPAGSAGIVVATLNSATTLPDVPTIDSPSWLSGAWTDEGIGRTIGSNIRLTIWSGKTVASPGSAALVATITGSPTGCCIVLIQVTGQDTTDFLLQPESASDTGVTSISATLNGALAGSDSACLAFIAHNTNEAQSPTGSELEIEDNGHNSPTRRLSAQYEINDTTTGASWTTSGSTLIAAMELKAAATVTPIPALIAPSQAAQRAASW